MLWTTSLVNIVTTFLPKVFKGNALEEAYKCKSQCSYCIISRTNWSLEILITIRCRVNTSYKGLNFQPR